MSGGGFCRCLIQSPKRLMIMSSLLPNCSMGLASCLREGNGLLLTLDVLSPGLKHQTISGQENEAEISLP